MTEEWASLWNQALASNADYYSYCRARENGDTVRQQVLEGKFKCIAAIYDEFGNVDGVDERGIESPHWKAWFEPRAHLFLLEPKEGLSGTPHLQEASVLRLTIPLEATPEATVRSVSKFIELYYGSHVVTAHPPPKYQLRQRRGKVACGYEQVRQECLTSSVSYTYNEETGEPETRIKIVILKFLKDQIDALGWSIDPEDRIQLQTHCTLEPEVYDLFRPRVDKLRRDLKLISQNALLGRFPDDSEPEIESAVVDQFLGE